MRTYKFLVGFLLLINITSIAAPLLWAARETLPVFGLIGKFIYFVYSFTCHQLAYRSFYLFENQWAWCARDVGIWAGVLLAAASALHPKVKGIAWYWVIPFVLPIALDGGIQTIATLIGVGPNLYGIESNIAYLSNNLTRFATGALFGIGIGLWVMPNLKLAMTNEPLKERVSITFKLKFAAFLIGFIGILYVTIMASWVITSPRNQPSNLLDSQAKLPLGDIFVRRANGACPTDTDNLLALDCFF